MKLAVSVTQTEFTNLGTILISKIINMLLYYCEVLILRDGTGCTFFTYKMTVKKLSTIFSIP